MSMSETHRAEARNELSTTDLEWLHNQVDRWSRLRPFEAEEVVELTLIEFARCPSNIEKPRHWLLAAAKMSAKSFIRCRAIDPEVATDPDTMTKKEIRVPIDFQQCTEGFEKAMASLSDDQRAMVEMCDIAGMRVVDAARDLKARYPTAKSWRHRGRQSLISHPAFQAIQKGSRMIRLR